jgi:long-chain acyl-CoA synthetase
MKNTTGTTLCESIAKMPTRSPDQAAYMYKKKGVWKDVSWQDYHDQVRAMGLQFLELGIKPEDKIALMSSTRWEWSVTDLAAMSVHAVVVPIYQTVTPADLEYILNNSQARFLVLETRSMMKLFLAVREKCPSVEKIFVFEDVREEDPNFQSWHELLKGGKSLLPQWGERWLELLNQTRADQVATLVYTSGTTGLPKGVVLTHTQIMSEVAEAFPYAGAHSGDTSLSFMPYAHVLGRIEHWGHAFIGFTLAFAESIERVRVNLVEVKPTIMVAVPRIFEKVYAAILTQIESNPIKRKMFARALEVGMQVSEYRTKREPLPLLLHIKYVAAQKLVLHKVKDAFGGRLRFAISGGAPLAREIAQFFHACEIMILEGYGLTETTGAVTVNTPYDYEFGTIGKPIGDVEIKFGDDGELFVRSKKVMREYFKDPESTDQVLKDGWLATGDIGERTSAGFIKITDRKKDLIKTGGGKYVAPQKIEGLLKLNPLVSQVLIHGDNKKYIVALITLDPIRLEAFAKEKGLAYQTPEDLTQNNAILEVVRKSVAEVNSNLASYETIKRFAVLPKDFTVESGELTPSLKVKRKFIDQRYRNQLEKLYGA